MSISQFLQSCKKNSGKSLIQLFDQSVSRHCDQTAITFYNDSISYKDLDQKVNRIAHYLNSVKIGTGDIVAVLMERSIDTITAILGILKSGAAYLPIYYNTPEKRIQYIIHNSQAKAILINKRIQKIFNDIQVINIKELSNFTIQITNNNEPEDLCYVIYTSGTTGIPKGICIEHKSVYNFLDAITQAFAVQPGKNENFLALTSFAFDVSVCEIFFSLVNGENLILLNEEDVANPQKITKIIYEREVNFAYIPPFFLKEVLNCLKSFKGPISLNKLLVGVEPIKPEILDGYSRLNSEMIILNGYGPSETTICSTWFRYKPGCVQGTRVPIGKPINNTKVYVLDDNNQLCPPEVKGELYISGMGLARGYLNNEELTGKHFIDNPFEPGTKMYKTGDLVKIQADGNILFVDRADRQIKMKGYRIELSEIEALLLRHDPVEKVFVVFSKQDNFLTAYLTMRRHMKSGVEEIRKFLNKHLPQYMVPSYIIIINSFPLNSNGKIDINRLPDPAQLPDYNDDRFTPPENELQVQIVDIWKEVLGDKKISVNVSFFFLNGDSLSAVKVINQIEKLLKYRIPLHYFLNHPTVKELAEYITVHDNIDKQEIIPVSNTDYYPVSSEQKRLYLLNTQNSRSLAYNITIVREIEGNIDFIALNRAFQDIINRHSSFRTCFSERNGRIIQKVAENLASQIIYVKLEDINHLEKKIEELIKPYDLAVPPLFRIFILSLLPNRNFLIFDIHHIIFDGISLEVMFKEISQLYNGKPLKPIKIQYRDYAVWQQNKQLSALSKQKEFWFNEFRETEPVTNLPYDYKNSKKTDFQGEHYFFELDKNLMDQIKLFSKSRNITLFTLFFTAYSILIAKLTGQSDIVVGIPVSGRQQPGLNLIIGMFVNTLPIRCFPDENKSFNDYLFEMKEKISAVLENQEYQYDDLIAALNENNNTAIDSLFETMFVFQNMHTNALKLGTNIRIKPYRYENKIAKFNLSLFCEEIDNRMFCTMEYNTNSFSENTIIRFTGYFSHLLFHLLQEPENKIVNVPIMSNQELNNVIYGFNETSQDLKEDLLIHELFEVQVSKSPQGIALDTGLHQMSYTQLNQAANQQARFLLDNNAKQGSYIAIFMNRSHEMIITVLSILKAGKVYVPLDINNPAIRISEIVTDLGIEVIVVDERNLPKIMDHLDLLPTLKTILVADKEEAEDINEINGITIFSGFEVSRFSHSNLKNHINSSNLAYIIFTSGSTGKPKGVAVQHRPVINILEWVNKTFHVNHEDKLLFITSLGFDLSVYDIFGILAAGAQIRLALDEELREPEILLKLIYEENITFWNSAPAALSRIMPLASKFEDALKKSALRLVFLSGDWIPLSMPVQLKRFFSNPEVISLGGATEATIWSNYYPIKEIKPFWKSIPYGRPIQNAKYYILDQSLKPCPIGIPGDLYIGGECLAAGYINDPVLTARKFIESPFFAGEKIYKTGDMARWYEDGNIEFLGRLDNQVKIRGFRVEIGEVEKHLSQYPEIKQLVIAVCTQEENDPTGEKFLCAYYVSDSRISSQQLKCFLSEFIPEYMIPTYFIRLDHIPITQNGKVDRKKLTQPQLFLSSEQEHHREAETEMERKLCNIFKRILKRDRIGVNDDFFELGGNSLKAVSVISMIYQIFNTEIAISQFFNNATVRLLSKFIDKNATKNRSQIIPAEKRDSYPLSFLQTRFFIINQLLSNKRVYNITYLFKFQGKPDITRLNNAFIRYIKLTEIFRTAFLLENGQCIQRIIGDVDFSIQEAVIGEYENIEEKAVELIYQFDLGRPPLLNVHHITNHHDHFLLIDFHHIISDAVTINIVFNEVKRLYHYQNIPPKRLQYKDYCVWQRNSLSSDLVKQKEYWLDLFKDSQPVLEIDTDYNRPEKINYQGEHFSFLIPKSLIEKIIKQTEISNITPFMVLFSVFKIMLTKLSGQDDFSIGIPISCRDRQELQEMTGNFINTLSIRTNLPSSLKYAKYLEKIKDNFLNAYKNKDYPFEELLNQLDISKDQRRNPLFDVMFSYLESEPDTIAFEDFQLQLREYQYPFSKFDLTLYAKERNNDFKLIFEFATALFKKSTIERFSRYFQTLVSHLAQYSGCKISDIKMIPECEENTILSAFNQTACNYKKTDPVHILFEEQVDKTPDKTAIICGDQSLTYAELNAKANQLAWFLIKKGVSVNEPVALFLNRSLDMVIAILGVLKAGAAYLAIDTSYPTARINFIVKDSRAQYILTNTLFQKRIPNTITPVFLDKLKYNMENSSNLSHVTYSPDNVIYIIYTSGTTGNPKGLSVLHKGFVNLVLWYIDFLNMSSNDNTLVTTSYCFDLTQKNFFASLLTGGYVKLLNSTIYDPVFVLHEIKDGEISYINCTPSMSYLLLEAASERQLADLCQMKYLVLGGEPINTVKLRKWFRHQNNRTKIVNSYGPTECTDVSTAYFLNDEDLKNNFEIPIGKPISNVTHYILNYSGELCPIGVSGELYIGGIGVSNGYINLDDLTKSKFKENPFHRGGKFYRTGDIVKWRPDGNVVFKNRNDHQIKTRGCRIETTEIEQHLLNYNKIKNAAVIARGEEDNRYLCAYYESNENNLAKELKQYLSKLIPVYMIPAYMIHIDNIPITNNGKLNIKALPKPQLNNNIPDSSYIAPRDSKEEVLVNIWQSILNIEKVGVYDNFFDLGGNSINAFSLVKGIKNYFDIDLPLSIFFRTPTINDLALYLDNKKLNKDYNLICLKTGNPGKAPIFVIHGLGGGLYGMTSFFNVFISDRTIYGIQSKGFDKEADFLTTVEDMAEYYNEIIKNKIGSHHPVIILGRSIGGVIGIEMGYQLERKFDKPVYVGLLDTMPPSYYQELKEQQVVSDLVTDLNTFFKTVNQNVNQLIEADTLDAAISYYNRNLSDYNILRENFDLAYWTELFKANNRAINLYNMKTINSPLYYFRALDNKGIKNYVEEWKGYTKHKLFTIELIGNHQTIYKNHNKKVFAEKIEESIELFLREIYYRQ